MACLEEPPSVQGRRLFELLEEKQEPFLLDIYLLENGYSDRPIRCRSLCWSGIACKRVQRLANNGFSVRLFRCMVSNLLHAKSIRKALKWNNKPSESRSLSVSRLPNDAESKIDQGINLVTCPRVSNCGVLDGEPLWKCMEMDEPKNHRPVSVLDPHFCKASRVHQTHYIEEEVPTFSFELQRKALDIFEELLQMAYTPAFDVLTKPQMRTDLSDKLPAQCNQKEASERVFDCHECLRHKMTENAIQNKFAPHQKQNIDLSIVDKMTVWELSKSSRMQNQFQHQETKIGSAIEDAIFEDMIEETVAEMLGFSCVLIL